MMSYTRIMWTLNDCVMFFLSSTHEAHLRTSTCIHIHKPVVTCRQTHAYKLSHTEFSHTHICFSRRRACAQMRPHIHTMANNHARYARTQPWLLWIELNEILKRKKATDRKPKQTSKHIEWCPPRIAMYKSLFLWFSQGWNSVLNWKWDCATLNWIELNWIELNWIETNWIELN